MSQSSGQVRVIRFFEQVPLAAALFVIVVAIGTLWEWYAGLDPTTGFFPGGIAMLPLSCVVFGLNGLALAFAPTTPLDQPGDCKRLRLYLGRPPR